MLKQLQDEISKSLLFDKEKDKSIYKNYSN